MSLRLIGSTVKFSPASVRAPKRARYTGFGKNHLIDREILVEADNRKANAPRNLLAVGEDKFTSFFSRRMPILSSICSGAQVSSLPLSTKSFGMITDRDRVVGFSILHLV
jgi:hypothetical protein